MTAYNRNWGFDTPIDLVQIQIEKGIHEVKAYLTWLHMDQNQTQKRYVADKLNQIPYGNISFLKYCLTFPLVESGQTYTLSYYKKHKESASMFYMHEWLTSYKKKEFGRVPKLRPPEILLSVLSLLCYWDNNCETEDYQYMERKFTREHLKEIWICISKYEFEWYDCSESRNNPWYSTIPNLDGNIFAPRSEYYQNNEDRAERKKIIETEKKHFKTLMLAAALPHKDDSDIHKTDQNCVLNNRDLMQKIFEQAFPGEFIPPLEGDVPIDLVQIKIEEGIHQVKKYMTWLHKDRNIIQKQKHARNLSRYFTKYNIPNRISFFNYCMIFPGGHKMSYYDTHFPGSACQECIHAWLKSEKSLHEPPEILFTVLTILCNHYCNCKTDEYAYLVKNFTQEQLKEIWICISKYDFMWVDLIFTDTQIITASDPWSLTIPDHAVYTTEEKNFAPRLEAYRNRRF